MCANDLLGADGVRSLSVGLIVSGAADESICDQIRCQSGILEANRLCFYVDVELLLAYELQMRSEATARGFRA